MPPSLQELGLDRLSIEDRMAVADALWDSVEAEDAALPVADDEPLTPELEALIDRRLAEREANPSAGVPWEVVEARLRERLKR